MTEIPNHVCVVHNLMTITPFLNKPLIELTQQETDQLYTQMFKINCGQPSIALKQDSQHLEKKSHDQVREKTVQFEKHILQNSLTQPIHRNYQQLFTGYMRSRDPLEIPLTAEFDFIIAGCDSMSANTIRFLQDRTTKEDSIASNLLNSILQICEFVVTAKNLEKECVYEWKYIGEMCSITIKLTDPKDSIPCTDGSDSTTSMVEFGVSIKFFDFLHQFLFLLSPVFFCRSYQPKTEDISMRTEETAGFGDHSSPNRNLSDDKYSEMLWRAPIQSRLGVFYLFDKMLEFYDQLVVENERSITTDFLSNDRVPTHIENGDDIVSGDMHDFLNDNQPHTFL